MHQIQKFKILCFGDDNFISSIKELKAHLNFDVEFTEDFSKYENYYNFQGFIFDEKSLENSNINKKIRSLNQIKIILFYKKKDFQFTNTFSLKAPIKLFEINRILFEALSKTKYSSNSSVKVKDYVLDKNERKLSKNNKFIILTEKEIQLLELLTSTTDATSKNSILEKVWQYSSEADTHTVETHIYRLRKKVKDKFNDENFIMNKENGYLI